MLFTLQDATEKKLNEKSKKADEETVDFVIENRSSKKSIDLPDRSETQISPVKAQPAALAPGKLKMRWLQASKWQEESADPVVSQQV